MADNRKIVALQNTLWRAFEQWESLFNQLNEDIAYASYSSEDNPKGNISDSQWEEYLREIKAARECFSNLGTALYRLAQLQKHAKPQRQR